MKIDNSLHPYHAPDYHGRRLRIHAKMGCRFTGGTAELYDIQDSSNGSPIANSLNLRHGNWCEGLRYGQAIELTATVRLRPRKKRNLWQDDYYLSHPSNIAIVST